MGFILYILSLILSGVLFASGMLFSFIKGFVQVRWLTGLKNADRMFFQLATAVDKFGNVVCKDLFNATLIKKDSSHKFGQIHQTISQVIGYNLLDGTLTRTGRILNGILDFFDKDHSIKAITTKR